MHGIELHWESKLAMLCRFVCNLSKWIVDPKIFNSFFIDTFVSSINWNKSLVYINQYIPRKILCLIELSALNHICLRQILMFKLLISITINTFSFLKFSHQKIVQLGNQSVIRSQNRSLLGQLVGPIGFRRKRRAMRCGPKWPMHQIFSSARCILLQ